jgi:DNA-binding PadR family transcriptional regulator
MPPVEPSLTPTSYLVLGLVAQFGPSTSYDLKAYVRGSIGYFWTFPHSQLYAEPVRLAALGLLAEERETAGRKRRTYAITAAGRAALTEWLGEPTDEPTEIRDLAVLKLFFGSLTGSQQRRAIAERAAAGHRARLAEYEAIDEYRDRMDVHHRLTLEVGLRYERNAIGFWDEVAQSED